MRFLRLVILLLALSALPARAQDFPQLSGRVVDAANLLSPDQEAQLTQRLEALERASTRQLVVVTIASLQGYPIEDYGYRLGRHWNIGQRSANNGAILIIAPNERKVRVEVGYGLEPILTDAFSNRVIDEQIVPRFRAGDMPGGILAGADALIEQLQAPPEAAEARVRAAMEANGNDDGGTIITIVFWLVVVGFIVISMIARRGGRGRRYRRGRRGPVVIWGSGLGGSGYDSGGSWSSGSSWSSGGGSWGGGGGGFSGGGGSFGGGGASGGW
jgi:uncharacterized protein